MRRTDPELSKVALIVEDNSDDYVLLQRVFRRVSWPYHCERCVNADNTIAYLAGEGIYTDRTKFPRPSLLLLDMYLPGGHGDEVLQWLQTAPDVGPLLVIVLCGALPAFRGALTKEHENGVTVMSGSFLKPLTLDTAASIMAFYEHWLTKKSARPQI